VFRLARFTTPRTIMRQKPAEETADESFDGLPPGMSPPRMMSPAAPPRSSAELGLLKLALSPVKDTAERIKRDLLSDVQMQSGGSRLLYSRSTQGKFPSGAESSMSTVPTPPSLSRYTQHEGYGFESSQSSKLDSTLESVMQRVGLGTPAGGTQYEDDDDDVSLSIPLPLEDRDFDLGSDSDSDSEEIHDAAHPSQAFLLASQQNAGRTCDDSDDSLNQSLDQAEMEEGLRLGSGEFVEDFEDSLDADGAPEEGTVFGLPPARREAILHDMRQSGLRLFGANLVEDDTMGTGQRRSRVAHGMLDETPTPWARASHG
jgi:DASH complex subunit ASK1